MKIKSHFNLEFITFQQTQKVSIAQRGLDIFHIKVPIQREQLLAIMIDYEVSRFIIAFLRCDKNQEQKDLGHFPYQSAHGKILYCVYGIIAHMLTLHCHVRAYQNLLSEHFFVSVPGFGDLLT